MTEKGKEKIHEITGRNVITFFFNPNSKSDLNLTRQDFRALLSATDFADVGCESLFHTLLRFTFSHQGTDVLH